MELLVNAKILLSAMSLREVKVLHGSAFPATGNTESSTYIIIIAVAGVLLIAAAAAGVITKKKK